MRPHIIVLLVLVIHIGFHTLCLRLSFLCWNAGAPRSNRRYRVRGGSARGMFCFPSNKNVTSNEPAGLKRRNYGQRKKSLLCRSTTVGGRLTKTTTTGKNKKHQSVETIVGVTFAAVAAGAEVPSVRFFVQKKWICFACYFLQKKEVRVVRWWPHHLCVVLPFLYFVFCRVKQT